jgi:hypothetical protein
MATLLTLMISSLIMILLTTYILCLDCQNLCLLQELDVLIHNHLPPANPTAQDLKEENCKMELPETPSLLT